MTDPYKSSTIPSYQGYNWAGSEGADTLLPGEQRKKKRKQRANPNDPQNSLPTPVPNYYAQQQRRQQRGDQGQLTSSPGLGGMAPPTTAPQATDPATYNRAINAATLVAPSGSEAARFPGGTANPFAIPMAAADPSLVSNDMMARQFGLPAGSATATELAKNFNPYDKVFGLGVKTPTSDVDWVNLGAALMGDAGGPMGSLTGGAQMDPRTMMTNMVSSLVQEVNNLKSGGKGAGDQYNPLAELANQTPSDALNSFKGMVQGMLQGTMPDQEITGYVNFLDRIGQQFLMQFMHGNSGQMQADGASFITYLVQQLGPSLGL